MSTSRVAGVGTGPITLAPVGSAPNANAATLVGSALNLQPASSVFPGVVNIVSQTFKGVKSFTDTASFNNGLYTTYFQLSTGSYIGPSVDGSFGYDGVAKRLIGTNGATWDTYVTRSDLSTTSIGINTGDVTLAAIGAVPNANAATLTGQVLNLQPASASFGGIVTTGTQAFAGAKTFNSAVALNVGGSVTGGNLVFTAGYGIICQDTSGNLVIQITPSANGAIEIGNSLGAGTTPFIDFHYGVGVTQDYNVRLINNADGVLTCAGTFNATNISGTNTGNVTLSAVGSAPNANAATLIGQAFNLQPADGSNPGVVTAGAQTLGGGKTFSAAATFTLGATFSGNATFGAAAVVDFGSTTRALVSLYGNHIYSVGVQPNTFFQRSGAGFAWYSGGVYSNTANDPGAGGTVLATLSNVGNLSLTGSATATVLNTGNLTGQKINLYAASYGFGLQPNTIYFRSGAGSPGGFVWYDRGTHSDTQNDPGAGGTTLLRLDGSGNLIITGSVSAANLSGTNTGDGAGSGGSGVASIANLGSAPNSAGGSIAGTVLTLQPASVSFPGLVSSGVQTFAGSKTFNNNVTVNGSTNINALTAAGNVTAPYFYPGYFDTGVVGAGGTKNLNWNQGNFLAVAINTASLVTFSFTAPPAMCMLYLDLFSSVAGTVAFPASVRGFPPTGINAGKNTIYMFLWDGASFYYYLGGVANV